MYAICLLKYAKLCRRTFGCRFHHHPEENQVIQTGKIGIAEVLEDPAAGINDMKNEDLWIPKIAPGRAATDAVEIIPMNEKEDPTAVTTNMMKGKTDPGREILVDMTEHPPVMITDLIKDVLVIGNNDLTNATNMSKLLLFLKWSHEYVY